MLMSNKIFVVTSILAKLKLSYIISLAVSIYFECIFIFWKHFYLYLVFMNLSLYDDRLYPASIYDDQSINGKWG